MLLNITLTGSTASTSDKKMPSNQDILKYEQTGPSTASAMKSMQKHPNIYPVWGLEGALAGQHTAETQIMLLCFLVLG